MELQSSLATTIAELEENLKSLRERTSFQGGEREEEGERGSVSVLQMPPIIVPVSYM